MKKTKKHFLSIFILSIIFLTQFLLISSVDANPDSKLLDTVRDGGLEEIGKKAYNESGDPQDIRSVVVSLIKVFLTFLGIIFMALMIYSGYV
jgi:hypothetical protein